MAYKIAFFGAKPYDIASFDKINERYEFDIRYYKGHLNINNVVLTQGVDAVCIFVNDTADAARHIAKNMVAAGVADEMLVQVSYAIGVAKPMNIFVNTFGRAKVNMTDGEIAAKIWDIFDMRPKAIEERLKLRNPIYFETASYGHMGRKPQTVTKTFSSRYLQKPVTCDVELFTWEKLDYADKIKDVFGL